MADTIGTYPNGWLAVFVESTRLKPEDQACLAHSARQYSERIVRGAGWSHTLAVTCWTIKAPGLGENSPRGAKEHKFDLSPDWRPRWLIGHSVGRTTKGSALPTLLSSPDLDEGRGLVSLLLLLSEDDERQVWSAALSRECSGNW